MRQGIADVASSSGNVENHQTLRGRQKPIDGVNTTKLSVDQRQFPVRLIKFFMGRAWSSMNSVTCARVEKSGITKLSQNERGVL